MKVGSFFIKENIWVIKYTDGTELKTENSPIKSFEIIGETDVFVPLDVFGGSFQSTILLMLHLKTLGDLSIMMRLSLL